MRSWVSARVAPTPSPRPARSSSTRSCPRSTSCGMVSRSPPTSASIRTGTSPSWHSIEKRMSSDVSAVPTPSTEDEEAPWLDELTPRQIVAELDKYIVGQTEAKKAVAIALRNRWRRQRVPQELRDEIMPNNIIMIGPTGVGKTEIARRLAKLAGAPFVKVEASKFTEVGYVGRDVESMIRDLADIAI